MTGKIDNPADINLDEYGRAKLSDGALADIEGSISSTHAGAGTNYFSCSDTTNSSCTNWNSCINTQNSICSNQLNCGGGSNGYCPPSTTDPGPGDP